MKNALTIDFEDWYQGLQIPCSEWGQYEDRIEQAGDKLLQMLADADVQATFFILGYVAEHYPQLIQTIAAAGHEIGTHGYSHTLIYEQDPETFREELAKSIHILEDQLGQPIFGHRAPFFSITKQSLWALDILANLNVRYDSSIFPVVNYRYGIADAPRWPYEMQCGDRTLTEFPISTLRMFGRNLPIAGGAYFRILPYRVTQYAFQAINRQGHSAVFYLHPWELDPDHPRIPMPRKRALTHYFNLKGTEARFRRLLQDFSFVPMRELLDVH